MSTTKTWSPNRVAVMLHVSIDKVIEAIEQGELSANRVGEGYVITREQLAAFMLQGNPFARRAGPTDKDLMVRAQQGDYTTFEELEERYRRKIWALCYSMLNDRDEADDLTQETLVKIFCKLNQFDPSRPLSPWILQIAANTCLDRMRSQAWRVRQNQVSWEEAGRDEEDKEVTLEDIFPSPDLDPQQRVERAELWRAVKQCLRELTPRKRLAINARFFEGQTYRKMMPELDVTSERGAKYVVDEAIQQLRVCLRGKGYEIL